MVFVICGAPVLSINQVLTPTNCNLNALPTEVGLLAQLDELDLRWNKLSALPTELGLLAMLTKLALAWNNLTVLPTEVGLLAQLDELDLRGNSLTALPTEIGLLEVLTDLDLRGNSLTMLPTEVGLLDQLTELDLLGNGLAALPTEIGLLDQLTELHLNYNDLTALPTEVGLLAQLEWLDLGRSSLTTQPSDVGIARNRITALPTEVGLLAQLDELRLGGNSLTVLPTEVGLLADLDGLDLEGNNLTAIPTEVGLLAHLQTLNLEGNSLTALPTEIGLLAWLKELDLGGNSLTVLPTELGLLTTFWLDLEGNSLNELPFPPKSLSVTFVSSSKIDLNWRSPVAPFTAKEYQARVASGGVTEVYSALLGRTAVGINLLHKFPNAAPSQATFTIQVKAEFEGEELESSWSKPLNVTTCPAFMQREKTNDVKSCYALAGFYRNRSGLARSCASLERDLHPGAIGQCLNARLGIEGLPVQEGFWRANLFSEDIRLCPRVQFCLKRPSNVSLDSPDRYCARNHSGIYCSNCVKDNVLGAEGCTFCTKEAGESTGYLVLLVCSLLLLFVLLYVYVLHSAGCFAKMKLCSRHGSRRRQKSWEIPCWKEGSQMLSGKVLIWTKVRILFGYFQVLSSYRRTFLKQTLAESSDLLGVMALVSNVDVTWLVGNAAFRCFYDYTHYDLLLGATIGPIIFAALLFACTTATAYCMVRRLLKPVRDHTESAVLLLLFLVYPYVSQTVLATLWCESFPDADRRFNLTTSALRADYRLSCEHTNDPERLGFEVYAGVMVIVYPVGVVALYSWVLYAHKDRVIALGNDATAKTKKEKLRKVSFLIKPYNVKRFWFEAYELVRKLVLTSFVGFLAGLPVERDLPGFLASISLSLTVVFVVGLLLLRPYKHHTDFAFAVMSLLLLLPASLYSLLDPYARHERISNSGLEALVITELCVFGLFVVFEIARSVGVGRVTKHSSCADRCLKEGGFVDGRSGMDGSDNQEGDGISLVARKQIAELQASLEFFKAENERLRDEKVSLIQRTADARETSIQPL